MSDVKQLDFHHPDNIRNLINDMLKEATKLGATDAEIAVGASKGFSVVARKGEVESIEYNQDKGFDITVYFGQKSGTATLSDLRPEAIHSAIQAACNIARFADVDDCNGIAEKDILAFHYPEPELYYPWNITVEHAIELACECEARALSHDKRLTNSDGVTIGTGEAWHGYGNTRGFIGIYPTTRHEISCVLMAKHGSEMQRDYSYTTAVDADDLESIGEVAKKAAERTIRRLGAKRLSTRRVPVIFSAEESRGLLGHFASAIQGGSIYRKMSFLLDQLDKSVFPKHIRIHEEPFLPKKVGSAPFDDDGVLTRPNVFIDQGILKTYALGIYSARKLGMKSTGNAGGTHNLFITTGDKNLPQLLKAMGTGLLVTELMGQGVNLVTGDYSRGASGFWIENGAIEFPVEEITIAGNLKDMYGNLVEVGNDVDRRGNIQTGSILLESMIVAGH